MLRAFIQGMRASRRIGAGERCSKAGDHPGALRAFSEALDAVDPKSPLQRASAPVALVGYCQAAQALGLKAELLGTLTRWRPAYLGWLEEAKQAPVHTHSTWESAQLQWVEDVFQHLARDCPPVC